MGTEDVGPVQKMLQYRSTPFWLCWRKFTSGGSDCESTCVAAMWCPRVFISVVNILMNLLHSLSQCCFWIFWINNDTVLKSNKEQGFLPVSFETSLGAGRPVHTAFRTQLYSQWPQLCSHQRVAFLLSNAKRSQMLQEELNLFWRQKLFFFDLRSCVTQLIAMGKVESDNDQCCAAGNNCAERIVVVWLPCGKNPFLFWYLVFRPSATVSRMGLMESCTCHCRGGPPPTPWLTPLPWLANPPRDGWLGRSAFALTKRICLFYAQGANNLKRKVTNLLLCPIYWNSLRWNLPSRSLFELRLPHMKLLGAVTFSAFNPQQGTWTGADLSTLWLWSSDGLWMYRDFVRIETGPKVSTKNASSVVYVHGLQCERYKDRKRKHWLRKIIGVCRFEPRKRKPLLCILALVHGIDCRHVHSGWEKGGELKLGLVQAG